MSEILVEVVSSASTAGDLSARSLLPERFQQRAVEVADSVADVAVMLRDSLARRLDGEPKSTMGLETVDIEFSVNLQSETGVVIARASANAGFRVRLSWKHRPASEG
jgi:hypothetical protein